MRTIQSLTCSETSERIVFKKQMNATTTIQCKSTQVSQTQQTQQRTPIKVNGWNLIIPLVTNSISALASEQKAQSDKDGTHVVKSNLLNGCNSSRFYCELAGDEMLHIQRRVMRRGALHPIQLSILAVEQDGKENLCKKLLLRCEGKGRTFRMKPGEYILRAREVPLGLNVQSEELRISITDDSDDHVYVILKIGTLLQVLASGLGGCFLPGRLSVRTFYFDVVSPEAFQYELEKAPERLQQVMRAKLGDGKEIHNHERHVPLHQIDVGEED